MMTTAVSARLTIVLLLVLLAPLVSVTRADAQEDRWSFILTPQIWLTHIDKNGFGAPASGAASFGLPANLDPLVPDDARTTDKIYPQWGFQIAAQKGRWTLAGSFQYVNFETRTGLFYRPEGIRFPSGFVFPPTFCDNFGGDIGRRCISSGERYAQEFVDTTRLDVDLSVSHFFPDVVTGWLDLSVGGGVKAIYASASRQFSNLSPLAAAFNAQSPPGLYLVCRKDDCSSGFEFKDRVYTKTWLYGLTIPMSAIFHLSSDAKWLLPLSVTPFIGAETRDDQDVVYQFDNDPSGSAKRLDGTTFAYGATVDATVRYLINESVSAYGGMRVQYIKGHEKYLAYGPLFGMSVRFGGR